MTILIGGRNAPTPASALVGTPAPASGFGAFVNAIVAAYAKPDEDTGLSPLDVMAGVGQIGEVAKLANRLAAISQQGADFASAPQLLAQRSGAAGVGSPYGVILSTSPVPGVPTFALPGGPTFGRGS